METFSRWPAMDFLPSSFYSDPCVLGRAGLSGIYFLNGLAGIVGGLISVANIYSG